MSKRRAVAGGALIVMMLLTATPGRAAVGVAPDGERITYVANDGTTYESINRHDTPAGRVALAGKFRVKPSGKTFRLWIDDKGTLDGDSVRVQVSGPGLDFDGCLPVRTSRKFTVVTAGKNVTITLLAVRWYYTLPPTPQACPATAGVVIATGVV